MATGVTPWWTLDEGSKNVGSARQFVGTKLIDANDRRDTDESDGSSECLPRRRWQQCRFPQTEEPVVLRLFFSDEVRVCRDFMLEIATVWMRAMRVSETRVVLYALSFWL